MHDVGGRTPPATAPPPQQVHYDNQLGVAGEMDDSGVRMYHTLSKRTHSVGAMLFGDPNIDLRGTQIPTGLSRWDFECPGAYTSTLNQPLHFISRFHHMHVTGARMETGEVSADGHIVQTVATKTYDFFFQVMRMVWHTHACDATRSRSHGPPELLRTMPR